MEKISLNKVYTKWELSVFMSLANGIGLPDFMFLHKNIMKMVLSEKLMFFAYNRIYSNMYRIVKYECETEDKNE